MNKFLKAYGAMALSATAVVIAIVSGSVTLEYRDGETVKYVNVNDGNKCLFTKSIVDGVEVTKPCSDDGRTDRTTFAVLPGGVVNKTGKTGKELKKLQAYTEMYEDLREE
jgi:hypothetical protein